MKSMAVNYSRSIFNGRGISYQRVMNGVKESRDLRMPALPSSPESAWSPSQETTWLVRIIIISFELYRVVHSCLVNSEVGCLRRTLRHSELSG